MIDSITLRFVQKPNDCCGLVAGPVIKATEMAMSLRDLMVDEWLVVAVTYRGSKMCDFNWSLPRGELQEFRTLRDSGDVIVTRRYEPDDRQISVLAKLRGL